MPRKAEQFISAHDFNNTHVRGYESLDPQTNLVSVSLSQLEQTLLLPQHLPLPPI